MSYVCPEDATNLDIFIRIVDDVGQPIETDFEDSDLSISFIKEADTDWTELTLVTGSYAGYLANKFIAVPDSASEGLYKLSLPSTAINPRKLTLLQVTYGENKSQQLVLVFTGPKVFPTNWSSLQISLDGKVTTRVNDPVFQLNIPPSTVSITGGGQLYVKELERSVYFEATEDIEEIDLVLIIEYPNKIDKLIVPDIDLTKDGNSVAYELPDEITNTTGSYNWGIRNANNQHVYGFGSFSISYAPHVDDVEET
jgi:hypothetical protein